ncbi:MAG: PTS fructose transporter subunit IIA [Liquorilactobacillus satsumensis]
MKYLLLVSHGVFAVGLISSLAMFVGEKSERVLAIGLKDGESSTNFGKRFKESLSKFSTDDTFVVLGDIIGGSPLTTVCNLLAESGRADSLILGGMNLPLAINVVLQMDDLPAAKLAEIAITEGRNALKRMELTASDDDDEDEEI